MAQCSVCSAEASKYKCVNCKAQSCSLPCFKTHAAQCTADPPGRGPSATTVPESPKEDVPSQQPQHPTSTELTSLFTQYPTLKAQLQDLYRTTQRPDENTENHSHRGGFNSRGRGRGRGSFPNSGDATRNWTPEKGFDRGLKQLQRALEQTQNQYQSSGRSEALQVFVDTVLQKTVPGKPQSQEDIDMTGL